MAEIDPARVVTPRSLAEERSYWLRRLGELEEVGKFIPDLRRPAGRRPRRKTVRARLSPVTSRRLDQVAAGEEFLSYTVVTAAFHLLMRHYCRSSTTVIGSPPLRDQGGIDCPANVLAIPVSSTDSTTTRDLLLWTRRELLEAYDNQRYPWGSLSKDLNLRPFRKGSAPAEVVLMWLGLHGPLLELDNDFTVSFETADGGVHARLDYDETLYRRETATGLLARLDDILLQMLDDIDGPVGRLALTRREDAYRLQAEINRSETDFPRDRCLHQLFEAQVELSPDAPAVICGKELVTYGALNRGANQLAHRLKSLGVGPGVLVAVCAERSAELVAGMVAVLKAGGAYLPIDPAYPGERIRFMLEDSRAPVLLTHTRLRGRLPELNGQILYLDGPVAPGPEAREEHPLRTDVGPKDLCYVIYSSGSTGKPKGIMLDHRGRVNNFCDFTGRFRIGPSDKLLAVSSLGFDMSAFDIFGTLSVGATIVLPDERQETEPARWVELVEEHGVSIWHSAPQLLEVLLSHAAARGGSPLRSLRLVLLGGDWIPLDLPDRLASFAPQAVEVISLGGATESSMDSTLYPIEKTDKRWKSIPYGQPMANQTCFVLNRSMQIVPVGVPGELHLGGIGLAWGYSNRSDLTADKFIPNPFSEEPGSRLYRTGDLARYLPDGNLELLGRMDRQVKVRGFRVELGEIESVLAGHPAVESSIAVAERDGDGDVGITAYVVSKSGEEPTAGELRDFITDRLPQPMVPSAFVMLDALPLTPNGKVDRRKLPTPSRSRRGHGPPAAPRNRMEARLLKKWSKVLGIGTIGIDDDFFALGGDSMKAMRVSQIGKRYVPILEIYASRTIRKLAERLSRKRPQRARLLHQLTPGNGAESRRCLLCVPYAGGSAIVYQPLADALSPHTTLYSVALPGHDLGRPDERLLPISEVASRCVEELRDELQLPLALYGHCGGATLAVEITRQLEEQGVGLEALFVGGAIPHRRSGDTEQMSDSVTDYSDDRLHDFLVSLGAFHEVASSELPFVLEAFRHDGRSAEQYVEDAYRGRFGRKLRTPVRCLIGSDDPLTPAYQENYTDWHIFSSEVDLFVIEGGHYFIKNQARAVARIIETALEVDASPPLGRGRTSSTRGGRGA